MRFCSVKRIRRYSGQISSSGETPTGRTTEVLCLGAAICLFFFYLSLGPKKIISLLVLSRDPERKSASITLFAIWFCIDTSEKPPPHQSAKIFLAMLSVFFPNLDIFHYQFGLSKKCTFCTIPGQLNGTW